MREVTDCACVADDAEICFTLRYPNDIENHEKCTCPCHEKTQKDYDYNEEDEE